MARLNCTCRTSTPIGLCRTLLLPALVLVAVAAHGAAAAEPAFVVRPDAVELAGNFARAQLLVTAAATVDAINDRSADLTHQATYRSTHPEVVSVSDTGLLLAQADGQAEIFVAVDGRQQRVTVTVAGVVPHPEIGFAEQVIPILSKAGCNAGACHSSQYGKGGFKLSVFGFAPDEDHAAIVRDQRGRRVSLLEPAESLLLLKPTMVVPHGGNRRLSAEDVDYQILAAWLEAGAPAPKPTDAKVTRIEVTPNRRVGAVGLNQQLRVSAHYSDGAERDVTAWARFDSLDDAVAAVTDAGHITATGQGETSIMVRFEGQAEIAVIGIPYASESVLAGWKNNNYVDELASRKFEELGIEPSPLCDDATFVRRVFLDLIGTLPTAEEAREFIDSQDADKRPKLIDRLLGLTGDAALDTYNNQYAAWWSIKWADLIRSSSDNVGEQGMWALHNWLQESLRANKRYDQFVRELVTANGSIYMNGPANYYRIANNPADLAETTSQLFLGVRLACAKCHHHPFEKYSQEDYYSFAAFFARVGTKTSTEFGLFGREQVVMVRPTGDVRHPKTNQVMVPTPLEGAPLEGQPLDRRLPLAEWLTSPDNGYFSRSLVNRYMAYLLGRGLVEPVDDMRATNPPSNVELMEALARDFVESGFNLKHLLRTITNSRLYQLDSQPTESNAADSRFYSHYRVKRLAAEPLLDAIDYATGVQTKFRNLPLGTRAIELPDSNYPDYFLTTFGKPRRNSVCECERVPDENLSQALHTLNGSILSTKISSKSGRVARLVAAKKPLDEVVTELYLVTLSRPPRDEELAALAELAESSGGANQAFYEDLLWSLINSKAFLFVE